MLDEKSFDILFREARSQNGWLEAGELTDRDLRAIWDIAKWGPTSANCSPLRIIFLRSKVAKERLKPHLHPSNVNKVMTAPIVGLFGFDLEFFKYVTWLFHNPDARSWYEGSANAETAHATAFRNSSLQAAYVMIAARGLGLDCGPLSGFDGAGVDKAFWAGTSVRTNFICGFGRGDPAAIYPRQPRFEFEDVCKVL